MNRNYVIPALLVLVALFGVGAYLSFQAPSGSLCTLPNPRDYNVPYTQGKDWIAFHRLYAAPKDLNIPFADFLLSRLISNYPHSKTDCNGLVLYEFNVSAGNPAHTLLALCDSEDTCQVIDIYYCGVAPEPLLRIRELCTTQTTQ